MSLVNCRECAAEISSKAKGCPHCGVPAPAKSQYFRVFALTAILIALAALTLTLMSGAQSEDKEVKSLSDRSSDVGGPPPAKAAQSKATSLATPEVVRSWQEWYCEWAWKHNSTFPDAETNDSDIVSGGSQELSVSFTQNGRKRKGRCTFTPEGRAVPDHQSIDAPVPLDAELVTDSAYTSSALQEFLTKYTPAIEARGVAEAHLRA